MLCKKKKVGDDREGVGKPLASLPLFFWGRRSLRRLIFCVGLLKDFWAADAIA